MHHMNKCSLKLYISFLLSTIFFKFQILLYFMIFNRKNQAVSGVEK